jgi:hypothetical protein
MMIADLVVGGNNRLFIAQALHLVKCHYDEDVAEENNAEWNDIDGNKSDPWPNELFIMSASMSKHHIQLDYTAYETLSKI